MGYDNNTNIRYHISKELSKHRQHVQKTSFEKINDFAIPVFAGLSAALFTRLFESLIPTDIHICFRIIFLLLVPAILYIVMYNLAKYFMYLWRCYTYYYGNSTKKQDKISESEDRCERIAKFNYEVTNLVHSAYLMVLEKKDEKEEEEEEEEEYNLMMSIFYLDSALKKTSETLLLSDNEDILPIPLSRIDFTMSLIKTVIKKQELHSIKTFKVDIEQSISQYNILIKRINLDYKTGVTSFNNG